MSEIPKLEKMESSKEFSDHINGFQHTAIKSDSLVLDMERLEKDITANSRIKLQRSLSRKGTFRGVEKKNTAHEKDISVVATSPRGALHGGGSPEKPPMVAVSSGDNAMNSAALHNQITIMNGSMGNTAVEPKLSSKRFMSFRRSPHSHSWTIDPRRILLFFATLSSIGTILLIYCTLHMSKNNEDFNGLD